MRSPTFPPNRPARHRVEAGEALKRGALKQDAVIGFERRHWVLAVAAIGFAVAALFAGQWLGGGFDLGRRDAALAIPSVLGFALLYTLLVARAGHQRAIAVGGAALLAALVLPVIIAFGLPSMFMAWSSVPHILTWWAMTALALAVALILWRRSARLSRVLRTLLYVGLAVAWWLAAHVWLGRAYVPHVPGQAGRVVVLTSLPLVQWQQADGEMIMREDAALTALRAMSARPLALVDALEPGMLKPEDRLLLAHPRALAPETLVEIDRFIRAGGRAVVLADGLSGWPPPHGFGDPRNPPVTSLLTPLLDYWGIQLAAPVPGERAAGESEVLHWGYRLRLHSAGHFNRLPAGCRGAGGRGKGHPVIARCKIGRGWAILLADADLLFAPLWQSSPSWARHLRPSDNIEWVAQQMNEPQQAEQWVLRPIWNR